MNKQTILVKVLVTVMVLVFSGCGIQPGINTPAVVENTTHPPNTAVVNNSPANSLLPSKTSRGRFEPLSSPISFEISVARPPLVNETFDLTLTAVSTKDAPGSIVELVMLPKGLTILNGTTEYHVDLAAGIPVTFTITMVFTQSGHKTIMGTARCPAYSWGKDDAIYIDVGNNRSEVGWKSGPFQVVPETGRPTPPFKTPSLK